MFTQSVAPRKLQLFNPANGGDVFFTDIGEALEIDQQNGLPEAGESLVVKWTNPETTQQSTLRFYHNFHIFLQTVAGGVPGNSEPISRIPDEQLLASCSMGAILAGEVHPGTYEFLNQVASDQNTKDFQTILLACKIKGVSLVNESQLAPEQYGKFYDIEFMRTGQSGNTKVVRSDIVEISKYINRASDFTLSVHCVPGAITTQFGKLITANLGASDSQTRLDIIDWVKNMRFYC
jgi:hypothetical protein